MKGFTLVELLVVIAIIGLLSTIVLVSFGPVRNQAKDTAIKANMDQMKLAAEIEYNAENDYSATDSRVDYIAAAAAAAAAAGESVVDYFTTGDYCIQVGLVSGGDWCVDSTSYMGTTAGCEGTNYTCASE